MGALGKKERAALEAVARRFSAAWEKADGDPDAYLTIAGKRVAVDIAAVKRRIPVQSGAAKPRLRLDRVALRLVQGLQERLSEFVPDGDAVIVTVTAPIRLPSKTAAALESKVRDCLARSSVEIGDTIHGNQIRVHLVRGGGARRATKVIGFVHNPESDPEVLLNVTRSLLGCIGAAAAKSASKTFTGDRWLIVADEDGLPHIETYRHIYAQLAIPTGFKEILIVLAGGRVESLTG